MDSNVTIQMVWTVLVFITFTGIIFWAYSSARKKDFDAAANLILDDDKPKEKKAVDSSSKNK